MIAYVIKDMELSNVFKIQLKALKDGIIEKNNAYKTIKAQNEKILEEGFLKNEKKRSLSLFGKNLGAIDDYFGNVYCTTYRATFAELAQAHRHRTLDYKIEMMDNKEYFVPPIINGDNTLVEEWLRDMNSIKDVNPQGEMILINECGKYEDFILKCKERLCSAAQLEIAMVTKATLTKYEEALNGSNHYLKDDIKKYSRGARCTFKDFICTSDCLFKEGKLLTREV